MNPVVPTAGTLADRAATLLQALGGTPGQVAASLERRGCHGVAGACTVCPIAVYLMRSDLGLHHVAVEEDIAVLFTGGAGQDYTTVALPDPVQQFIARFDRGGYRQLLAGGARHG